ncbi:MotA/TolQ/ExbB proton channel family protein, partial [Hyphomonas atlantica]|uniref:MotA/TolQ/ExbB proton channel family protein n=1 Tax=Hyphomonas atlantica TaxID=1280948 RepID=UPI003519CD9E
ERIEEAMEEAGRHVVHGFERYLNALGTIAATTPLLGLLGTVIGMIKVFAAMDHALDHRDVYIRKLRRALGAPRALLKPIGKRLYRRGPLTFLQCQTARALEAEAQAVQPYFNSS